MDKPMFADVKAGDRVWGVADHWGTVEKIRGEDFVVRFDRGVTASFSFEGKVYPNDGYPSLFWDEVKIIPPPRPKRRVTKTGWVHPSYIGEHKDSYEPGILGELVQVTYEIEE